jgi:hypothetical protein
MTNGGLIDEKKTEGRKSRETVPLTEIHCKYSTSITIVYTAYATDKS